LPQPHQEQSREQDDRGSVLSHGRNPSNPKLLIRIHSALRVGRA
jgi:hypothetical protein